MRKPSIGLRVQLKHGQTDGSGRITDIHEDGTVTVSWDGYDGPHGMKQCFSTSRESLSDLQRRKG